MTKKDLVDHLSEHVGLSKKESLTVLETCFDAIKEALSVGRTVKVSGFGTFDLRHKAPRQGRNPRTGESVEIGARRVITFRPSEGLKHRVKGRG